MNPRVPSLRLLCLTLLLGFSTQANAQVWFVGLRTLAGVGGLSSTPDTVASGSANLLLADPISGAKGSSLAVPSPLWGVNVGAGVQLVPGMDVSAGVDFGTRSYLVLGYTANSDLKWSSSLDLNALSASLTLSTHQVFAGWVFHFGLGAFTGVVLSPIVSTLQVGSVRGSVVLPVSARLTPTDGILALAELESPFGPGRITYGLAADLVLSQLEFSAPLEIQSVTLLWRTSVTLGYRLEWGS